MGLFLGGGVHKENGEKFGGKNLINSIYIFIQFITFISTSSSVAQLPLGDMISEKGWLVSNFCVQQL